MFVGNYKFGKPDGEGQYTWKNGSVYKGQFMNGMKHGKGKWMKTRQVISNIYEGDYYMDKKQGQGEFRWSSGNVYKGTYKNDLRNGYGEMYWTDGSIYKGNWVNGIQHGYGKMYFLDGTVNEGVFDHNVYQGPVGGPPEVIDEESYDDEYVSPAAKNKIPENSEYISSAEDAQDLNSQKKILPEMTRHNQKENKKRKSKIKRKAYIDTEDEEIQEIIQEVKANQKRRESLEKNQKSKSRSKSKLKKKILQKEKNKTRLKSFIASSRASSQARGSRKSHVSIQDSLDTTTEDNDVSSVQDTQITPKYGSKKNISHQKINKMTNVTINPKSHKKSRRKKAKNTVLAPELKQFVVSSNTRLAEVSNERHSSVAKSRHEKESSKMFSRRLFADREKTIGGTNTLATHGLHNRRSRAGKYSKATLQSKCIIKSV